MPCVETGRVSSLADVGKVGHTVCTSAKSVRYYFDCRETTTSLSQLTPIANPAISFQCRVRTLRYLLRSISSSIISFRLIFSNLVVKHSGIGHHFPARVHPKLYHGIDMALLGAGGQYEVKRAALTHFTVHAHRAAQLLHDAFDGRLMGAAACAAAGQTLYPPGLIPAGLKCCQTRRLKPGP